MPVFAASSNLSHRRHHLLQITKESTITIQETHTTDIMYAKKASFVDQMSHIKNTSLNLYKFKTGYAVLEKCV